MLLLSHNLAYSRAMCFLAFVFLPAVAAAATPVAVVVVVDVVAVAVDAVVTVSLPLCDNSHNKRDLGLSYFLVYFLSFLAFIFVVKQMFNKPNRRFAFYAFLLAGKIRRFRFYSQTPSLRLHLPSHPWLLFIVAAFSASISAALMPLIGLRIERCLSQPSAE